MRSTRNWPALQHAAPGIRRGACAPCEACETWEACEVLRGARQAEEAVELAREAARESADPARESLAMCRFDDEMKVITLDGEVDEPHSVFRGTTSMTAASGISDLLADDARITRLDYGLPRPRGAETSLQFAAR